MIMGLYENLSSSRVPLYARRISQKHACYKYEYAMDKTETEHVRLKN